MIKLGVKVRDKVTGFVGVAICRVKYLNGCVQYGIKPPVGLDNKALETEYIDEGQLEVVREKKAAPREPRRRTGGPSADAPRRSGDLPNESYFGRKDDGNWAPR